MRGKPIRNKNKILVALVALFTMLMCTSVGFAAWVTSGASTSANTNGNIAADDYVETTGGDAYCISNVTASSFRYYQGCGFVDEVNGKYAASIDITGTFTFNVTEARSAIDSLGGSKSFSLEIALTTTMPSGFTYAFAFTGFSNTPVSKSTTSTSAAYNITLTDAENALSTMSCGFTITMTYGSDLSGFPSLASVTNTVTITPDEVIS